MIELEITWRVTSREEEGENGRIGTGKHNW